MKKTLIKNSALQGVGRENDATVVDNVLFATLFEVISI